MKRSTIITGTILLILVAAVFIFWGQYYKLRQLQHCSPWRIVTGHYALCKELTIVSNCAKLNCNGAIVKKAYSYLTDANNTTYSFSSTQPVSVTVQNQMIARANIWAYANAPANYAVEFIEFVPAIATTTAVTFAQIEIKVTYKICKESSFQEK